MITLGLMAPISLIDHTTCPPEAHRSTADPERGETSRSGRLVCPGCGGRLVHCARVAAANDDPDSEYQRTYLHTDPNLEETCR